MKSSGTIFVFLAICIGIGVLWYIGRYTVSVDAVPSLQEYIASTTQDTNLFASSSPVVATSTEFFDNTYQSTLPKIKIKSPNGEIQVFVAKTPESRTHGLSGYPSLSEDQGMLFIFPVEGTHSFWMKDMNFAIDIVWMDSDRKIVEISENVTPESYPKTFSPSGLVQFVLEVGAGEAKKHGFEPGMTVMF